MQKKVFSAPLRLRGENNHLPIDLRDQPSILSVHKMPFRFLVNGQWLQTGRDELK